MYRIIVMDVFVDILSYILIWIIIMEYVRLKQKNCVTLFASVRVYYNVEIILKIVRVFATRVKNRY
jgi:hypothetical protein